MLEYIIFNYFDLLYYTICLGIYIIVDIILEGLWENEDIRKDI